MATDKAPTRVGDIELTRNTGHAPWEERTPVLLALSKAIVCFGFAACILLPLWMVVATSFATPDQVGQAGGMILWPGQHWSLNAYRTILSSPRVPRSFMVSVFVTAAGTILATIVTTLAAYGLSRPGTLGHRFMLFTVLFTYLFGPGMIPVYLVVRNVGLYNTLAAMFVPSLFWAFNMVILRSFFMGLPQEILDSARIDGTSEWGILRRIVLPLSKAPIAVIALFYGVGFWNNFFSGLLYEDDAANYPLQLVMRDFVLAGHPINGNSTVTHYAPQMSVQMAVVMVAMIPVMIVYPFVQKHFVQGVVIGAVKG